MNVITPCRLDVLHDGLGKVSGVLHDFNELLPLANIPVEELEW